MAYSFSSPHSSVPSILNLNSKMTSADENIIKQEDTTSFINFEDITIPTGNRITGFVLLVNAFFDPNNTEDDVWTMSVNGGAFSDAIAASTSYGTSFATITHGSSTTTWGVSETLLNNPSTINFDEIVVRYTRADEVVFYIDQLVLLAYYAPLVEPPGGQIKLSHGQVAISEGRISL